MRVKAVVFFHNRGKLKLTVTLPQGSDTGDAEQAIAAELLNRNIDLNNVKDWRIESIDT